MNGRHLRGAVLTQQCPVYDEDVLAEEPIAEGRYSTPAEDRIALFGLCVAAVVVLLTLWFIGGDFL
jgi:hypothetical protein